MGSSLIIKRQTVQRFKYEYMTNYDRLIITVILIKD